MTLSAHWTDRLRVLNACDGSLEWAVTQESPLAAWRACENGSWLLWIAARLGVNRRLIVTAACKCARLALPHVPKDEDRPLKAIEAAERWVDGLATIVEVRQAAAAAYAAADVASVARVTRAADAAADAAYAAAVTAIYAADAAARAARAAAADAAAYVNVLRQCADIVRSTISEDVILEVWTDEEDAQ